MQTRTANIYLDDNIILHIVMLKGVRVDMEDAIDNMLVVRDLVKNEPSVKLVDVREGLKMGQKVKSFLDSKDVQKKTKARAIYTNNSVKKITLNFFLKYNSNSIPTKFFTDYALAIDWLKTFQ